DGLGLTKFKVAYFPDDDALLSQIGTANTNKGKLLPEENTIQNKVKTTLQQAVKAQFTELFKLAEQDPQRAQSLLKRIDEKNKNWKRGSSGLNDCYQFLQQELPKLQAAAKQAKAQADLTHDKEYIALQKKKAAIDKEYESLYQQYQQAKGEKQALIYEQLKAVIHKLDEERANIKTYKSSLEESRKQVRQLEAQIAAPERAREEAIAKLRAKILILQNPHGYTDPDTLQENRKMIKQLEKDIKAHESLEIGSKEESEANQAALHKALKAVEENEKKVAKANVLIGLFVSPASFKEVMKAERKKEHKGAKRLEGTTFDTKGMYLGDKNDEPANKRKFDARFLDANQLSRLARFFSHEAGEYTISDNDSLLELMAGINGVLGVNQHLNFDILMDIAEGRIKRKPDTFASYNANLLLDEAHIVYDQSRKPNYAKLLERAENYRDLELNKKRGITISKGGKYNERQRAIDISYMTTQQMEKLQQFFGRSKNELRNSDGEPDRDAITERINDLLNRTNLAYEDIIDISEGHLVRKAAHTNNEHFTLLIEGVERKGKAPNYEASVKQRADFIAEQARQRQAALEAARQQELDARQQSLAGVGEEAKIFVAGCLEQFEKPFKKRVPDYALDVSDWEEFQLFFDVVQVNLSQREPKSSAFNQAVIDQLSKMNPKVLELRPADLAGPSASSGPVGSADLPDPSRSAALTFTHDDTAKRVVKNILSSIDIKTRYKNADVKKNFALANYKMFQNKDRSSQLKMLQHAITHAKATMLSDPDTAFKLIEESITTVKKQLAKETAANKRKLGDSRLEKVVNDLENEVHAMRAALNATSHQISQRSPKTGG
ncbi:MAG: hypothetical protein AB7I18_08435, partial [Candidatus Berkiella sp.]